MLTAPRVRTPSETRPNPMERPARPTDLVELANVAGLTEWRAQDIVVLSDQLLGLQNQQSGALVNILFSSFERDMLSPEIRIWGRYEGSGEERWNRKGEIMKGCGCGTVADGYPPNSYHQQCPNSTICYTTIQETIMNNSLTSSRKITLTKISMISGKKSSFTFSQLVRLIKPPL